MNMNEVNLVCDAIDKVIGGGYVYTIDNELEYTLDLNIRREIAAAIGIDSINDIYIGAGISKVAFVIKNSYAVKISLDEYDDCPADDYDIWSEVNSEQAKLFPELYAKVSLVKKTKNREFFVQEFVEPKEDYDERTSPSDNSVNKAKKDWSTIWNVDWFASIIDIYGEEYYNKFVKYIENNGKYFGDMHDGNYGYTLDGLPKILDYAL